MSAAETVTLTIDGIAVEVPKGTGLVEAALAAGIEIPVFCYEPRLGPPVGACRMCLCPLGETAAIAVASYVEKFRAEFIAHVEQGGCPFGDSSPLHDVLAPVAMHLYSPSSAVPA